MVFQVERHMPEPRQLLPCWNCTRAGGPLRLATVFFFSHIFLALVPKLPVMEANVVNFQLQKEMRQA